MTIYLATAPKSNSAKAALSAALEAARESPAAGVPMHIRNAPTKLMKDLGYGAGYTYDHDAEGGFSGQNYFPDEMERQNFYRPEGRGREAQIKERLEHWAKLRTDRER
jgi:putative ATPase